VKHSENEIKVVLRAFLIMDKTAPLNIPKIFNMLEQRIYISEVAEALNRDKRTIEAWFLRDGLYIYSDGPNGRKYVSRVQFLIAWNREFIEEYQEKYGDRWLEALEAHMNVDVFMALKLGALRKIRQQKAVPQYKPSQNESAILSRLTGTASELP
jgi:hypothetical protein